MKKWGFGVLVLFLCSCGSSKEDKACEPGRQLECACPGGGTGYQVCLPDGSGWEECDCSCRPECAGKQCGDDGCGGSCGDCDSGQVCLDGACCTPECSNRECGIDPVCGSSCGDCGTNENCGQDGVCECPFVSCGDACCGDGQLCYENACCTPDCTGRDCGPDPVCDYSCGTCGDNAGCTADGLCVCDFEECGGACCLSGEVCFGGGCCAPDTCQDLAVDCGLWDDGCGGQADCGGCAADEECDAAGSCVIILCTSPNVDCSAPISELLPGRGQGYDVDGDDWGECCDCEDGDIRINPGRNEIIYNCLDDDCDPLTVDDDLDGDGYGFVMRICGPGTDCDDHDRDIHPGAGEICNNKDDDCDGQTDPPGTCLEPPDLCPDISGDYHVRSYCMQFTDFDTTIVQNGCDVVVDIEGIICTGAIDAGRYLYVDCGGAIQLGCTSRISMNSSWVLICSTNPQCSFVFDPVPDSPDCAYHTDPACTVSGQLCGVMGVAGDPETKCISTLPFGRDPGYYCDPDLDIDCENSLCIEGATQNYCGAVCSADSDCAVFPGLTCTTVTYDDGFGTTGPVDVCAPDISGETRCDRTEDCEPARVCSYRPRANDVIVVCRQASGFLAPGEVCADNSDCETNLCEAASGTCSEMCSTDADCIQGYECGVLAVSDQGGTDHNISACVLKSGSCSRDADCSPGMSCQVFISPAGDSLDSMCFPGAGSGVPDTGEWCSNSTSCFSVQCFDWPGYCLGLCVTDADCPVFDQDPFATCLDTDDDCDLGYRCENGVCKRVYECVSYPFVIGLDSFGRPIIDTANICMPERLNCSLDSECRSGEACKIYYDKTASRARYKCEEGGPGTGLLGEDCTPGPDECWTGICVVQGQGGPGNEYCSKACISDEDCENTALFYCGVIQIDVRPGFISYVPACLRRSP